MRVPDFMVFKWVTHDEDQLISIYNPNRMVDSHSVVVLKPKPFIATNFQILKMQFYYSNCTF